MKRSSTNQLLKQGIRTRVWLLSTILALVLAAPWVARGQVSLYSFSQSSATYTEITGGTVLGTTANDDEVFNNSTTGASAPVTSTGFPIGFGFVYNGVTYDKFAVNTNGYIVLGTGSFAIGGSTTGAISTSTNAGFANLISAFNTDLVGQSTSELRYQTIGTTPNQKLVVQWKNYRRYTSGNNNGSASFQIILSEGSNQIDVRYGTYQAPTSSYSAAVGLRGANNTDYNIRKSATSWATTTTGTSNADVVSFTPTIIPASGLTFTWNAPVACSGTPAAGTVAPLTQTLCNGATVAAITGGYGGFTGLSYQWEESNDNGVADAWANAVGGTGATTVTYTPPTFSGTPIYYRLRITCANGGGIGYSPSSLVTSQTAPATAASAVNATGVFNTSFTINWTNGNGGRRYVVINTANTFTDPVSGTTGPGTANTTYSGSGQQVVYDGTGSSVTVTGLPCASTIYVRVYEYNRCGTSPNFTYFYNTTPSGTNPVALATGPLLTNLPVNNNFTGYTGADLATVFPGWYEAAVATTGGSNPGQANPAGTTSGWVSSTAIGTTAKVNLYTNTTNEWIVSPKINITAATTIEFKAAITDYNSGSADAAGMQGTDDKVYLLVSTSNCGTAWTPIYTFQASNTTTLSNTLTQYSFQLDPSYIGQNVQFAFQGTDGPADNTPDYDFHIGDIKFFLTPSCVKPTGLVASNISGNSATLTWAAPAAGNTPANYQWKVVASGAGPNGTAVASGVVAHPTLTTPVTGLSITTTYDAYVRSECGGGDTSAWSLVTSFLTTQVPVTVYPYNQTFESGLDGWQTSTGSQVNKWVVDTAAHNGAGTHALYISNNNGPANAYTIGTASTTHAYRDFQIPAGFPLIQFSFDWRAVGENNTNDRMRVYVAPTSFTPQAGTQIAAGGTAPTGVIRLGAEFNNQPTFTTANYTLPFAYENQTFRLIFEWRNNGSVGTQPPAAVDNINFVLGTCSAPTALTATNITPTSVQLGWTETGPASTWDIEYGNAGFTPGSGTMVTGVTNNPYTLTPISPETTYSFYVRSDCGASESPWTGPFSFTTPCQPLAITGTTPGTRCGEGTVLLGATGASGAVLNWYAANTGGASLGTGTSFTTPSITANTTYYVDASTIGPNSLVPVGAGANTGTALPYNPLQGGYGGEKAQYLFTAAELISAGLQAGNITSIAFEVTATGSTLDSFAVEMGTTALTTFPTPASIVGGLTTVRPYAPFVPTVGVNTITLTTPFVWDGTSNIILSTSWSNRNSSNNSSTVKYDNTTNYSGITYRRDNASAAYMFGFTGATGAGTSTFDRGQARPRVLFRGVGVTCVSARTPVLATVTTPPAVTITATADTVCAGGAITLQANSANTGYSYVWAPGGSTNNPLTINPTATTSYSVTATDNSGGANNGCVVSVSKNIVVNPLPATPTVSPVAANLCLGGTQALVSTSIGPLVPIYSENFEGTVTMTTTNTSTGTSPANAAWTVRNNGYQNTGGTITYTFNSPDNSKFILTNSDAVGNGADVRTTLTTPAINTTGYGGLTLTFDHNFKARDTSKGRVQISTDGGTNWTTVQTYTTTDVGAPNAFVSASIPLNSYVNNANFRVRFLYTAKWDWFWAVDNVVLKGATPLQSAWTATPAGTAGLPAGAGTYSNANASINVTPTDTGAHVYTVTVKSPQGCISQGAASTITVKPLPVVDAGAPQSVCPGTAVTLNGSGANTYVWNNGVTNGTPFIVNATTTYTVTGTDLNNCQNVDSVTVTTLPATPVTIAPAGPITICQGSPLTLTANGPTPGPATTVTQWNFNASNTTASTGTGTASLVGGVGLGTPAYASGAGSTDPAGTNVAWSTTDYPAQGTGNKTAGVQFNVSTVGYQNLVFKYDVRFSGTAANTYIVQYNPDVTNVNAPWIDQKRFKYTTSGSFINNQTVDFSAVPAASNNANFGIRIVSAFDSALATAYAPVSSPSYGTNGTARYDMVTFTANPVTATYLWSPGGQTTASISPTTSGTYVVTVTEAGICPGRDSVAVTVNPVFGTSVSPSICANQTYTLYNGTQVNTAGIYTENRTSVNGCDSVVLVNLTVYPTYNTPVAATICSNEQYTLADGTQVNTAGTYTKTVPSAHNCDSTVVVTLTVNPAQNVNVPVSICANESYTLPSGTVVTAAGTYTSTFQSSNSCDSTITTVVTVKPVFTSTQNPAICQGDSLQMPDGTYRSAAGSYAFPFNAVNGCDSTITVNLTVKPTYISNVTANICPGDNYTLVDGTVVSTTGSYTAQTTSVGGCDSSVIVVLTVRQNYTNTVSASICQGDTYTLVNGTTVNTAGSHTAATQSVYGCDSVVTVNLTVNPTFNQTVNKAICQGSSHTLPNGTVVTSAGSYTSVLQSVKGCDSTIVTVVTVNPLPTVNLGNDIAIPNPPAILNAGVGFTGYNWSTGAQTQTIQVTQNGTYHVTVTNAAGCTASDTVKVYFTASVSSFGENGGSISLFPNPATERFAINVTGYTGGDMKLDLINAIGQVVRTEMVKNAQEAFTKEFDVATLPSGTYTLRVSGNNAQASLRVIIAR